LSSNLTRRDFLRALPVAAAATACRRRPYREQDFPLPPRSEVALFAADDYSVDLADVISKGLGILQPAVRGRRVLLKPNLVEYELGSAINTHPLLVAGAAVAFLRAGASEVVVAEGSGNRRDAEYLLTASGLHGYLRELRVGFVDLNHDDVKAVPLKSRFTGLDELWLPVEVLRADLVVSVAKLKVHHWAGMTAAMKNLFGAVPGAVYGWPKNLLHFRGIHESILDLNSTIRPGFCIVDAIVAMEGDGPISGSARPLGLVAMGRDPIAVDATCARIVGLDPAKLPYLAEAARFLGNADDRRIDQRAESPARFHTRFDVPPHLKHLRRVT
jgi:uncharacterized protein (DUF362 family)